MAARFYGYGHLFLFSMADRTRFMDKPAGCRGFYICALAKPPTYFFLFLLIPFAIAMGHLAANIETRLVAQPMLNEKTEAVTVVGRVAVINHLPDGYRLWLNGVQVEGLGKNQTPNMIRIKVRYQEELPEAGKWISVRAILYPLSKPIEPDAFNFRQYAFYQGYGATGFSIGKWRYAEGPTANWFNNLLVFFENIRTRITKTILEGDWSREKSVATALITGDQSSIPKSTLQAMRISGISHILSVSGLHITMVAGFVFFGLRMLLALIPWVALHWPIKKIAAFAAMTAAIFYTLMCAAPVPAMRAMIMSAILLIAIMVDRRAMSMRLVAIAAFLSLLFAPSALLGPSFQLSFLAVAALIAVYENNEHALWQGFKAQSWLGKIGYYITASVLTSAVASLATAPLIIFHFQQVTWYGVFANLMAVPLSSFIIMPAAVLMVLLMPFGLDAWPMQIMLYGIDLMLRSSEWVAGMTGAATYHPAMHPIFLLLSFFGLLWICLWQRKWRYLGILPFVLGSLGFLVTPRPDILVEEDAIRVAVFAEDGKRIILTDDKEDFIAQVWLQRDGQKNRSDFYSWFNESDTGGRGNLRCKNDLCEYKKNNFTIAFPVKDEGYDLCNQVDLIVAPVFNGPCPDKIISHTSLVKTGSVTIHLDNNIKIKTARHAGEHRPWD